jgi:hypothetical protein
MKTPPNRFGFCGGAAALLEFFWHRAVILKVAVAFKW